MFIAGTSPDWRANLGSNCQRGSLKPQRRFDTPMQRPILIPALIVTRLLPASATGFNGDDHVGGRHAVATVVRARAEQDRSLRGRGIGAVGSLFATK